MQYIRRKLMKLELILNEIKEMALNIDNFCYYLKKNTYTHLTYEKTFMRVLFFESGTR